MRTSLCVGVLASLVTLAGALPVRAGSWQFLGERLANFGLDHDVIVVTAAEGAFSQIQLRVRHARIEILDLKVHFGDGSTLDVSVRAFIEAGGETRVIDLPGGARVIRNVEFTYRTPAVRGKRALVRLFGR